MIFGDFRNVKPNNDPIIDETALVEPIEAKISGDEPVDESNQEVEDVEKENDRVLLQLKPATVGNPEAIHDNGVDIGGDADQLTSENKI